MNDGAIGSEYASVTRAMKLPVALKVRDSATKVRANRAGHSKPFVPVAENVYLLVFKEGGRAKCEVCRIADLE
jgi:hypothetical protein